MKRDMLRMILALAIVLVFYLLVVFLIPFVQTAAFWISFVFTIVAFFVTAAVIYIAFMKRPDAKSRFYGFPIAKIGVIYAIVQLAAGLLIMALAVYIPFWVAVLIQAAILAAVSLGLISTDAAVEEIHAQDQKLKNSVMTMRSLQSRVGQLGSMCNTPETSSALRKLYEEFRYSDPVSSPQLQEIERDLWIAVDDLQGALVAGSRDAVIRSCRACSMILAERNRQCKLYK